MRNLPGHARKGFQSIPDFAILAGMRATIWQMQWLYPTAAMAEGHFGVPRMRRDSTPVDAGHFTALAVRGTVSGTGSQSLRRLWTYDGNSPGGRAPTPTATLTLGDRYATRASFVTLSDRTHSTTKLFAVVVVASIDQQIVLGWAKPKCALLSTHRAYSSRRVPTVFPTERDSNSGTSYATSLRESQRENCYEEGSFRGGCWSRSSGRCGTS
jgi:hypothetical protein